MPIKPVRKRHPNFAVLLFLISFTPVVLLGEVRLYNEAIEKTFGQPMERIESREYQQDAPFSNMQGLKSEGKDFRGYRKYSNSGALIAVEKEDVFGTWIQSGHTGAWYNSNQTGHGLLVEILADETSPTGMKVLATWYAYLNGEQIWILAIGPVIAEGQVHKAQMDAWIFSGSDFPPLFEDAAVLQEVWGTLTLVFSGCNAASLEWTTSYPGFSSGQLSLERLSAILDSTCDPGLGGETVSDDHGDSLETATTLPSDTGVEGTIETEGDIDVFTFSLAADSSRIKVYTTGSLDTRGELFEVAGGVENSLETDNDDGTSRNFLIERDVGEGQFSVHVGATSGTGDYTLWLKVSREIEINFDNKLLRNIRVYRNGSLLGVALASRNSGTIITVSLGDQFSWEVEQDFGDSMQGFYPKIDELDDAEINYEVDNVIGSKSFFIPSLSNATSSNKLLGVNMELSTENRCNCVIPAETDDVLVGYFRLSSDSNCRFYEEGSNYGGDFLSWDNIEENVEEDTGLVSFTID